MMEGPVAMVMPFAFYGRVSTEDRQDPTASRAWQRDAALSMVSPRGGVIEEEYFDIGVSRRLPWPRRPEAARLLLALKDPTRGWSDLVVGEPQRAFQGAQYELVSPVLRHYGVRLWLPGIAEGPIDFDNTTQDINMSLWGTLSKAERVVVQRRVKDSMRSLAAVGDGRHLGGRPPYGYLLVDAGAHPNPSKNADGRRLHKMAPDPIARVAVRMIFDLWNQGRSLGEITSTLDRLAHPSPSTHDPDRNKHRNGGPWAKSAVRAILKNPRYTGHQVWGRQPAAYQLIDPDNAVHGDIKVQRWADQSTWTVTEHLAHEPLVSQEDFDAAQARFTARATPASRKVRVSEHSYLLQGRVICGVCLRRMEGSRNNGQPHYRCRVANAHTRAIVGDNHPKSVYVREAVLVRALDEWLARAFNPESLDATVADLLAAARDDIDPAAIAAARAKIAEADRLLQRYKVIVDTDSDSDLSAVVGWIREAQAKRAAGERRLFELQRKVSLDEDTLRAMIADVPDMAALLREAPPEQRAAIYASMDLRLAYAAEERRVYAEANAAGVAWVNRECPRGDLNPHSPYGELAPQASASANSATRTSGHASPRGAASILRADPRSEDPDR